jgi:hypothetical protein
MSDAEQLVALSESEDEKRKRNSRERKRAQRAKEALEEAAQNPERVEELWSRNAADFRAKNPKLFAEYEQRHADVAALVAEVDEIVKGVRANLRAETRTWDTRDSVEIFPCPDVCWRECMEEARVHGLLNYYAIEGTRDAEGNSTFRVAEGAKLEATQANVYRLYGHRLALTIATVFDITDAFVIYALSTGDKNLDWNLVRQAVKYRQSNGGWAQNDKKIAELIKLRTKKVPELTFDKQIARTLNDIAALGQHEIDL